MTDEEYLERMERNAKARIEVVEYIKSHPEVRESYYKFIQWCRINNEEWVRALYKFPKIRKFFYH